MGAKSAEETTMHTQALETETIIKETDTSLHALESSNAEDSIMK